MGGAARKAPNIARKKVTAAPEAQGQDQYEDVLRRLPLLVRAGVVDAGDLRTLYTPTGCLLSTGTEVNHLKRSGFSPRTML